MQDKQFLQQAISLAKENVKAGGRPFGAVIVRDGAVVATGVNQMLELNDPTAHAELMALRQAGETLKRTRLEDCVVYASGQPCPMCLAAMRMAGISRIIYAYSNQDAEPFGLSTEAIAQSLRVEPQQQHGLTFIQLKPENEAQSALYTFWREQQH
ncbi:nucleoside deaminase [Providencia stuartii]|uniref:Nucleoside deaminase n=1 Tax=Providencia stuartii TaxID=588 RepID=A0AAJ1N9T5_PROST|nr:MULTISPECIES: nucleoside deaminase [Providencia]EKT8195423.1 nucleoside deaminase [Klebsiella pneumoniae]EKW6535329.1 nucleoside deaminase [Proteus mirabilis]EKT8267136.1 nucleoside deaminase [Klebsiella pneumoniae]EKW9392086.1 nucleoside deaminase [Klebsiella pneumoniae]ELB5299665.1 nucleoside deaminase [Klebsiella pneumoniae]